MSFSLLTGLNKRTVRAAVNPMDRSTVVSIFPKDIYEVKPTIQPNSFRIPAGNFDNPSILLIEPASWWLEVGNDRPLQEITNSSSVVADAIVNDYCNGLQACDNGTAMPGLFYLAGKITVEQLKKDHQVELKNALDKQRNWYMRLVRIADTDWARSNGNPLAISDLSRLAAREMNLTDKEWLKDFQTISLVRCAACGTLKNPAYPVCANCKAISNPEAAKGLSFAQ